MKVRLGVNPVSLLPVALKKGRFKSSTADKTPISTIEKAQKNLSF